MIRAKILLLHIGSLKTGATAIQSFLCQNSDPSRDVEILYLRTMRQTVNRLDCAHHRLRQAVDDADGRLTRDLQTIIGRIGAELRQTGCNTWHVAMMPLDRHLPDFIRRMAHSAAA